MTIENEIKERMFAVDCIERFIDYFKVKHPDIIDYDFLMTTLKNQSIKKEKKDNIIRARKMVEVLGKVIVQYNNQNLIQNVFKAIQCCLSNHRNDILLVSEFCLKAVQRDRDCYDTELRWQNERKEYYEMSVV